MADAHCKKLPVTTTKEELKVAHKQRMALKKAAIAHEYNTRGQYRRYKVRANLSRDHKNYDLHPKEAY